MRGDSSNFRPSEVRDILRLAHALHEAPPDPAARKRALLERLCGLLRADSGLCVVSYADPAADGGAGAVLPATLSVVRYGMTEEDARAIAARHRATAFPRPPHRRRAGPTPQHPPPPSRRVRRGPSGRSVAAPDDSHWVESVLDVPGMKVQASLALLRRRPPARPFAARDRMTLHLVHSELAWVYGPELPVLSHDGLTLSPRQRQTLQLLLAGNSEKEIAWQMGLSHNTVHHYVKAIHRHFGVSSRSELLARWVRK